MCSDSFLILPFYSFRYLSFPTFHYEHGTFFDAKFYSFLYLGSISLLFISDSPIRFHFLQFDVVHVHKVINLFLL